MFRTPTSRAPRSARRAASASTRCLRVSIGTAAATDTDIEVQPVLGRFALRYHLEPDPRPPPAGIDDAVRANAQLILRHPDVPPVRIPAGEAIRRRFKLVSQCGGPEPCERLRVSAIDHQLEPHGHRSVPRCWECVAASMDGASDIGPSGPRLFMSSIRLIPGTPRGSARAGRKHRCGDSPHPGRSGPAGRSSPF